MSEKVSHKELLALWSIQESLLQSYRSLFISVNSILISFGASFTIFKDGISPGFFIILFIAFCLLLGWIYITSERAICVNICQKLIERFENGEDIENPLKQLYEQKYKELELIELNKNFTTTLKICFKSLIMAKSLVSGKEYSTRKFLQLLPSIFIYMWIVLAILS